jgi:hypothetical protein
MVSKACQASGLYRPKTAFIFSEDGFGKISEETA